MIGIITNKLDAHAIYVAEKLKRRRIKHHFFYTEDFLNSDFSIKLYSLPEPSSDDQPILNEQFSSLSKIDVFWLRRPFPPKMSPGSDEKTTAFIRQETGKTIEGLWQIFSRARWINDPNANNFAANKLHQLQLARRLGFDIPKTLVTIVPDEANRFFSECRGRVVVKAISKSWFVSENKISVIRTRLVSAADQKRFNSLKHCPTLFQELVDKSSEFRVTIIGEKMFTCEIHSQENEKTIIDYKSDVDSLRCDRAGLPAYLEENCLKLTKSLGLKYAAIDLIKTLDGRFVFLEINPNGQWLWIEKKTGMPIANGLIEYFLTS